MKHNATKFWLLKHHQKHSFSMLFLFHLNYSNSIVYRMIYLSCKLDLVLNVLGSNIFWLCIWLDHMISFKDFKFQLCFDQLGWSHLAFGKVQITGHDTRWVNPSVLSHTPIN